MNKFFNYFAKKLESGDGPVIVNFVFRTCFMDVDNLCGFEASWENALFKGLVN